MGSSESNTTSGPGVLLYYYEFGTVEVVMWFTMYSTISALSVTGNTLVILVVMLKFVAKLLLRKFFQRNSTRLRNVFCQIKSLENYAV